MRFLCVGGFSLILSSLFREIIWPKVGFNDIPCFINRFRCDLRAICSHISNEASGFAVNFNALIKKLGNLHSAFGVKAEFSGRFLLQGRSCEWCRGVSLPWLAFNAVDFKAPAFNSILSCHSLSFIGKGEFLNLAAL